MRYLLFIVAAGIAVGLGGIVAAGSTASPDSVATKVAITTNPEARMSSAERDQMYKANFAHFESRYSAWASNLDVSKLNLSTLPREELLADYAQVRVSSLFQAAASADVIVTATVTKIRPAGLAATDVMVRVDRAHKGDAGSTLVIREAGGLMPSQDWNSVYIAEAASEPLLLPGDRAVLLLNRSTVAPGEYEVEGFTGIYKLNSGKITSVPGNPFGADFDGQTELRFNNEVAAAIKG